MANRINVSLSLRTTEFLRSLNQAERSLKRSAENMQRIGASLSVSVTAPLAALGGAALSSFADMEKFTNGLASMMGSAEAARSELEKLRAIAQAPGLDLEQAVKGSVRLQSVGIAADQAREVLAATGNAIALVGGSSDDLDGVTLALQQIGSKGAVFAEEVNQINERLPQIRTAMQGAFGTSNTEDLQKMGISAEQFIAGITTELQKLPTATGGMSNAFNNARQAVQQALSDIGASLQENFNVTERINAFSTWVQDLATSFARLSPVAQKAIIAVAGIAAAAGPATLILSQFYQAQLLVVTVTRSMTLALGRLRIMQAAATASQFSLNAAMLANPVGVTVAAIAGLVAILAVVYKRNEAFRNSVNAIAKGLQVLASGALSIFKTSLQAIYIIMRSVIQVIVQTIRQLFALAVEITRTVAQFLLGEEGIKRFVTVLRTIRDAFVFAFKNVPALVAGVRSVLLQAAQNVANFFQLMGNEIQILVLKGRKAVTLFPDAKKEIQQQIDALRSQSENLKSAGMSLGEAFRVGFRSQAFIDGGGGLVPDAPMAASPSARMGDEGGLSANGALLDDVAKKTKKVKKEKEKLVNVEAQLEKGIEKVNEVQKSMSEGMEEVSNRIIDAEASVKAVTSSVGEYREGIEGLDQAENGWFLNSTQRWQALQDGIKSASGIISDGYAQLKVSSVEALGVLVADLTNVKNAAAAMAAEMGISFEAARKAVIKSSIRSALVGGFLNPIINIAEQLGKLAIGTGLAVEAIQKSLASLSGPVAIAAGVALLGAAAFAKSKMKQMATPFADGGIVMPRPGGIFANIGEAGKAEAVIPLDRLPSLLNTDRTRGNMTLSTRVSGRDLLFVLREEQRDVGRFV